MSKRKKYILISVTGLVFGVILILPNIDFHSVRSVMGLSSLIAATFGSVISIFTPTSYTYNFEISKWLKVNERDYRLIINNKKHGLGKSINSKTYIKNEDNTYNEVFAGIAQDEKGNITINSSQPIVGKIVINS